MLRVTLYNGPQVKQNTKQTGATQMNTYHIYQDTTGNFQAAVRVRNGKTNDRYINAGEISGRIKCRWTGYKVEASTAQEASDRYDEGDY